MSLQAFDNFPALVIAFSLKNKAVEPTDDHTNLHRVHMKVTICEFAQPFPDNRIFNTLTLSFGSTEYKSSEPQRGMCWLPRRALNTADCEIARAYKVTNTLVEPISFIVPRKV